METFEAIRKRRSIRSYTGDAIPKEDLEKIIDAGRLAPSGNNRQPWHFIVVTDKAMIQKLSVAADWSAQASAKIAVAMNTASKYWLEDGSAAVENMLLAATALGYSTCWLEGNALPHEDMIKAWLEIPQDLKLLTLIPVGAPVESPADKTKNRSIRSCIGRGINNPHRKFVFLLKPRLIQTAQHTGVQLERHLL